MADVSVDNPTPSPQAPASKGGAPIAMRRYGPAVCGPCGYSLDTLTEASRCPECGTPFVIGLVRSNDRQFWRGTRYASPQRLLGLPLISIAFGAGPDGPTGRARGFLAIGDQAVGVLAIGGSARGVVAIGGIAVGVFAVGGGSVGLVSAFGGGAVSLGFSLGGGAIGGVAMGGSAIGGVAVGGGAIGYIASGAAVFGSHVIARVRRDPLAEQILNDPDSLLRTFGSFQATMLTMTIGLPILIGLLVAAIAMVRFSRLPQKTT